MLAMTTFFDGDGILSGGDCIFQTVTVFFRPWRYFLHSLDFLCNSRHGFATMQDVFFMWFCLHSCLISFRLWVLRFDKHPYAPNVDVFAVEMLNVGNNLKPVLVTIEVALSHVRGVIGYSNFTKNIINACSSSCSRVEPEGQHRIDCCTGSLRFVHSLVNRMAEVNNMDACMGRRGRPIYQYTYKHINTCTYSYA